MCEVMVICIRLHETPTYSMTSYKIHIHENDALREKEH